MPIEETPIKLPIIKVGWNGKLQTVELQFDQEEFKTWEMVIAALDMATSQAKFNQELARMAGLQKAQHDMANAQRIRRNLGM